MKKLKLCDVVTTLRQLGFADSQFRDSDEPADNELLQTFSKALLMCRDQFLEVGLKTSYWSIVDCLQKLERDSDSITKNQLAERAFQIFKTIQWETEDIILFKIASDDLRFLDIESQFNDQLRDRFRTAADEIQYAGKCLAFENTTASVFHLMRALECAVKGIWATLNLWPPKLSDSWGALIGPMDKQLALPKDQRVPLWATEEAFFAEAVSDLRAIKKAWRDTTMHVERTYNREQALKVFDASLGLMMHLATRLDESGKFYSVS